MTLSKLIIVLVLISAARGQQQQQQQQQSAGGGERPFVRFQTFPVQQPAPQSFQQINFFAPISPQHQQQQTRQEFRFPPQFIQPPNARPQLPPQPQQQDPAKQQKPIVQFQLLQHQFQPPQNFPFQPSQQFQLQPQFEQGQQQRRPTFQLQFPEQQQSPPSAQTAQLPPQQPPPPPPRPAVLPQQPPQQASRVEPNPAERRPFVGSPLISVEQKDPNERNQFQPVPINLGQLQSLSDNNDESNPRDGRQLSRRPSRPQSTEGSLTDFQSPRRVPNIRPQGNRNFVPVVEDTTTIAVPQSRGTARFTLPTTTEDPEAFDFPIDPNSPRLKNPIFPERPQTTTPQPAPRRPVRPLAQSKPNENAFREAPVRLGSRDPQGEPQIPVAVREEPARPPLSTPHVEEVHVKDEETQTADEEFAEEEEEDVAHEVEGTPEIEQTEPKVPDFQPVPVAEVVDNVKEVVSELEAGHVTNPEDAPEVLEEELEENLPEEVHPDQALPEQNDTRQTTTVEHSVPEHTSEHEFVPHVPHSDSTKPVSPTSMKLDDIELTESPAEVSVSVSMSVTSVTQPVPTSRNPELPVTEAPVSEDALEKPKFEIFNLGSNTSKSIDVSKVIFLPNLDLLRPTPRSAGFVVSSVQTSRSVTAVQASLEVATESSTNQKNTEESNSTSDRQSKAILNASPKQQNLESQLQNKEPDAENLSQEEKTDTTESIIDKLDRVQSKLSDAVVTNGFRTEQLANGPNRTVANEPSSREPLKPSNSLADRPRRPFDVLSKLRTGTTTTSIITTTPTTTTAVTEAATEASSTTTTTTAAPERPSLAPISVLDKLLFRVHKTDDISAFLPPGFTPEPETTVPTTTTTPSTTTPTPATEKTTTKSLFDSLFNSAKQDDLSAFLPPGFKLAPEEPAAEEATSATSTTTTTTTEPTSTTTGKKKSALESLFEAAVFDDVSSFVPSNFKFKLPPAGTTSTTTPSSADGSSSTTSKTSEEDSTKKWLVFPTRAGGPARVTTEKPKLKGPPGSIVTIKSGWPVRSTTEFTGWPSPATPEYNPAAVSTPSTVKTTTSTTTTTTTTLPPRVTTPGVCGSNCRLAATIRLTDGITWVPELSDHNTREFAYWANIIEKRLTEAYEHGPLAPWFAGLEIEAFSRGSVLVDYYLFLNGTEALDTGDIRNYFHLSLHKAEEGFQLDEFTIDPKSTDFIVSSLPQQIQTDQEKVASGGVSDWVVAIIVIGMASLLFVIAFGTTVLMKRRRDIQKRNTSVPLTEEMLNELNKNHMGGVDNPGNDFYDVGDIWDNRSYTRKPVKPPYQRPASVAALRTYAGYNNFRPPLHDSWKSEWNGYMYNSHYQVGANGTGPRPSRYGRHSAAAFGRPRPSAYDFDDF